LIILNKNQVELLENGLTILGIKWTKSTVEKFDIFINELLLWNKKTNLVGSSNINEIIVNHIFDSLSVYDLLKNKKKSILDLGSGAGFPSIPLKIVDNNLLIWAVERRRKRVAFLENVSLMIGLKKFHILDRDIRDVKNLYDIVIARGVGKIVLIYELTRKLLKEKGMIIAFKGKITEIEKEVSMLKENIGNDKDISLRIQRVKIPYLEEGERNIVIIETK